MMAITALGQTTVEEAGIGLIVVPVVAGFVAIFACLDVLAVVAIATAGELTLGATGVVAILVAVVADLHA